MCVCVCVYVCVCAQYRAVRKAYELAVLTPASLSAHEPMLQQCISQLVARLARAADSGEPVDMVPSFSDLTMQAIGFVAFGVDLHCLDTSAAGQGLDKGGKLQPSDSSAAGQVANSESDNDWLSKPGSPEFGRGLAASARAIFRLSDPGRGSKWKMPVSRNPASAGH